MTKTLMALPMLVALNVNAAEFQSRDEAFVDNAAHHAITVENWDQGENAASTFTNAYKFTHSYKLNTQGNHEDLGTGQMNFDNIFVDDVDGQISLNTFLRDRVKNHSMVVLKNGQLVHEHYWNNMNENTIHLDMSVTKSFTSMAAQIAVANGQLDMSKRVIEYLPELKGTAWETATVQEVSDMRTSVVINTPPHFSWDPRMTTAQSYNSLEGVKTYPNGINDYFQLVTKFKGSMGEKYTYQCVNTEVLGKVVEVATGENLASNLERLWQKVGAKNDVYLMAGHAGDAMASGGMNASTKDLARIGKMIINDGKNYSGEQVLPKAFIDSLMSGNDEVRAAWKLSKESALADGWYKDQFRVLNIGEHKILAMVGIHGQVLAMDFDTDTVIAMNGGYPISETPRMAISIFYKTIPAIIEALTEQPIGTYLDENGEVVIVGESN
ncbi:serine hydrolase [Shewanella sp. KT0246]|uniref:serine hydrolase domain-containing protein n=1 Tax=Shewanella sp. KT0246 TaxID=2815912 RepID=UPI001BC6E4B9|nr:serine hydrolase [Shewanella sp. KT0246]GIU53176.1 6-aminohexanoate-dimer hydrolase [Shewanella sp. KT0246]